MDKIIVVIKEIWIAFSIPAGILVILILGKYLFKKKIKENEFY